VHFFDSIKLWISDSGEPSGKWDNRVTLSQAFWEELKEHPIPVDAEVVRLLARNPGCLDLYTWLTWRCHQAKGSERVPLFGPYGLANQLGAQTFTRERKFRERINSWLKLVRLYWPECPAVVSRNGTFLEVNRASAILPREAQCRYQSSYGV
jgi:Plasmid encoded RepA protein